MLDSKVSLFGLIAGLARKAAGLSGRELAARARLSVQTVSRHESGREGEEPTYETVGARFRTLGYCEEAVDVLACGLEPAFRPLVPPGVSWWLTPEDRARLRKAAVLSGAEWGRDAEAWLVAAAERALEEQDRREAEALCSELRRMAPEDRRPWVESDPRFHTWAVSVLLCDWSERVAAAKPARAMAWAELAVEVARRAPGEEARRSRLLGYATAFLANALRVAARLREAEAAFAEAWRLWEEGAEAEGGPLPPWRLPELEASLRRALREFDRALALLARALECAPPEAAGRILVERGCTLEQKGDVEAALSAFQGAETRIDRKNEPRLLCSLWLDLTTCFCHLEDWSAAASLLAQVRSLAFESDLDLGFDWLRIRRLGGKVAAGQGRRAEAIRELESVRDELLAEGNDDGVALVSLELSGLSLEDGQQGAPLPGLEGARREQEAFLEPGGGETSVAGTRPGRTEAVGVEATTNVEVGDRSGGRTAAIGVEATPFVEGGRQSGGRTAAVGIEAATGIQGHRGQEADEHLPRIPGRRGAAGSAGGERAWGREHQPQGEHQQGMATGRSRHRKSPFGMPSAEPPRPAGTPPSDRLPQDGKKSTSSADPMDGSEALSETAVLARWLRAIPACSQEELAERSGVDASAICRHETGKVVAKRRTLEKLASGLCLPFALVESTLRPLARTVVALLSGRGPWRKISEPAQPAELAGRHAVLLQESLTAFLVERGLAADEPARATPPWQSPALPEAIEELFRELAALPEDGRLTAVETNPAFQSWTLCPRLCEESARDAAGNPSAAMKLVELALRIAVLVPGPAEWQGRLCGYCGVFRSNALRVQGDDLEATQEDFDRAFKEWQDGVAADPEGLLPEWRLLDLEASLLRDRRRFGEALNRLARVLAGCPRPVIGRILVKKAFTLAQMGRDEAAIAVLREAEPQVDGERDPQLRCHLLGNLAVSLCQSGRPQEALELLPLVESLAERADKALDKIRVEWLRAQIDTGLGRREEARAGLEAVRRAFLERRMPYEVALVSLELSVLLLEDGKTAEVKELAGPMIEVFAAQRVRRETLAAVEVFCQAARAEAATAELAQSLRTYLRTLGG